MLQVEFAGSAPDVGQPNERANDVAAALRARERIEDHGVRGSCDVVAVNDQRRKVAAPHCFGRHREDLWFRDVVFQTFIRDEEERAVCAVINLRQSNWSTKDAAETMISPDRSRLIAGVAEEVVCRTTAIAVEIPAPSRECR